jgi:hypothetical protein
MVWCEEGSGRLSLMLSLVSVGEDIVFEIPNQGRKESKLSEESV